jgi:hypothetical protein
MIKKMVVELERDPSLYPDGNILEVTINDSYYKFVFNLLLVELVAPIPWSS